MVLKLLEMLLVVYLHRFKDHLYNLVLMLFLVDFGIGGFFRANGGVVSAGKSYMVGERGAEMFVPNAGGRIVPNSDLGWFN